MASRGRGGGRGGVSGRGGRGGTSMGGKQVIRGQQMPWNADLDVMKNLPNKPRATFPDIVGLPEWRSATPSETAAVRYQLEFRRRIHQGPHYMNIGHNARVGKQGQTRAARFDAFGGNKNYSAIYKPSRRCMPTFKSGQYCKAAVSNGGACCDHTDVNHMAAFRWFPRDLWSTVDSVRAPPSKKNARGETSTHLQRQMDQQDASEDEDGDEASDEEATGPKEKDDDEAADDSASNASGSNGDETEQKRDLENPDETFEDDDSEMGGDYNAEQYFDNGEEDDGDGDEGYDGGGGDDGGFY